MAPILTPAPLVAFPLGDLPFEELIGIDVDWLVDGPFEDSHGDEKLDEDVAAIPLLEIPVIDISSDTSLHFFSDSFESVTSSALQAVGLQRYATDSDEETAMSVAPIPPHDLEPDFVPIDQPDVAHADPEPLPDHDPIPIGIHDITPLIPDPVPAPIDPPTIEPFASPFAHAPANVAPFHLMESDVHRVDLPIGPL
ncbi:hypothetical protein Hanom_Chr09g00791151 [Helianthus anomalus]